MRRTWTWTLLALALLGGAAAFLLRPAGSKLQTLPALTLKEPSGQPFALASLKGKPVVLNAWASWCAPCRREMPMLLSAAKANPGVTFAFINQGEGPEAVKIYERDTRLTLPLVLLDTDTQLATALGFPGLPATFVFDRQGRLVAKHLGQLNPGQLEGYLRGL
jgi:thiol-disulfide isomerase/thioredoxin